MKIIHTADLHLDSALNTHLSPDKARIRRSEILNNFRRLSIYAEEHGVQAVLIAGDLFDTEDVSKSAVMTVLDSVRSCPDIEYFYLRGNHDTNRNLSLEDIPENLHLFTGEWTCYSLSERIRVYGREADQINHESLEEGLSAEEDKLNICLLHGEIREGSGTEAVIDLRALRNRNIDYLALGHIHTFSFDRLDNRGIYCYPGVLEGRGFDELGRGGFVLLDTGERDDHLTMEFVPFALREICRIPADVTGCLTSSGIIEKVLKVLEEKHIEESSLLSILLTGQLDVECEKDLTYIRTALSSRYFSVTLTDRTTYTSKDEDYRYEESLKGEFIRQVLKSDIPEEDKQTVIRYGLQALKNEEIE